MDTLLQLRQTLKNFYKRFDVYLLPALKFVLALVLFYFINSKVGYLSILNSIFVVLILSLVCAILPLYWMTIIGVALIVLHSFGIGMEIGFLALCIYIILLILFLRFVPNDSLAVLLTPLAFTFNMQAGVPIALGLVGKASSTLASVCAIISYFYVAAMPQAASLKQAGELSSLELLQETLLLITANDMLIYIIVFVAVTLIVYLIRKLLTTYGWLTGTLVGAGLYILLMIVGSVFMDLEMDIAAVIIGTLAAAGVDLVISFFLFSVNYRGSRYLQFEDDDYYYYVKAIPKNKPINYFEEEEDEDAAERLFHGEK